MSEKVAEYLGVDVRRHTAIPIASKDKPAVPCPFRATNCLKAAKGQVPICSVRSPKDDTLWIVCEHRLCSSNPKSVPLTDYQLDVLDAIVKTVEPDLSDELEAVFMREGRVRRTPGSQNSDDSKADFLVRFVIKETGKATASVAPFVLEMQGGGETSNTGIMSRYIQKWEADPDSMKIDAVLPIGSLETNAWRRQQEQFLIKGSVASKSKGRLVFAVGTRLFDKLMSNLTSPPVPIDARGGWTLAIIGICESPTGAGVKSMNSVGLDVDKTRTIFTDFGSFARALTDQGQYDPELFNGDFVTRDGRTVTLG